MGSFTIKQLEAHITLAEGGYDAGSGDSGNTKVIHLGMDVEVSKPGGKEKNKCTCKIYNMPLDDMEKLTTLAFDPLAVKNNKISIQAGDTENGLSEVFSGDITSAVPVFNADAAAVFEIQAITNYVQAITPVQPLTAEGEQDVVSLMQGLAGKMGLTFTNKGVKGVKLRNVAFVGGAESQARQIADAARIQLIFDDKEMIIAPTGALRKDDDENTTPVLSGDSGLIGFPSFDSKGIACKCLYEPRMVVGGPVRIDSIVPKASGLWRVTSLTHSLSANYGQAVNWQTSFNATYPNADERDDSSKSKEAAK